MTLVQFRASKFELYELVTLHWNSQEHQTKVVQRWFNPDDGLNGYWFDRGLCRKNGKVWKLNFL